MVRRITNYLIVSRKVIEINQSAFSIIRKNQIDKFCGNKFIELQIRMEKCSEVHIE